VGGGGGEPGMLVLGRGLALIAVVVVMRRIAPEKFRWGLANLIRRRDFMVLDVIVIELVEMEKKVGFQKRKEVLAEIYFEEGPT
jgi:hypothetical protein